jgi:prepilin-type N-terminal cleavage/methylation domain-containing protein
MRKAGFTLIELSIVLVIIGLIIGGVLVGRDLIKAAESRAQITQMEKYSTAVRTFQVKYGYLPGDMPDPYATQFGFKPRGLYAGEGDGNGRIEGVWADGTNNNQGYYQSIGETCMLWVDLSTANLIDGSFTSCNTNSSLVPYTIANVALYMPVAKIGGGNSVYVWSNSASQKTLDGNWFSISAGLPGTASAAVGIQVSQAYNIDKKIDDGLPQSGNVTVIYVSPVLLVWSGTNYNNINNLAAQGSSTTCIDNGNVAGVLQYSIGQNGGSGINCAMSFKMM